jgi:hypothetical protein
MNTHTKSDDTIEGGIREVLAAADLREANETKAAIPQVQRANPIPPMTKAAPAAEAPVTRKAVPLDVSNAKALNEQGEHDAVWRAIGDKEALVAKIMDQIEGLYRDLDKHGSELGQMRVHAMKLELSQKAHALVAQRPAG